MKKQIFAFLKRQLPRLLKWLKKQADNDKANEHIRDAGKAAIKIEEAINLLIVSSEDGIIDSDEMMKLAPKLAEASVEFANLLGFTKITIKRKNRVFFHRF